jgi:anti-sigma B factor antagonist
VSVLNGCRVESFLRPDGSNLVEIVGEIDRSDAEAVTQMLVDIVGSADATVDLGGLSFIDSSGLGAFVQAAIAAREAGFALHLVRLTPNSRRMIEITGLGDVLNLNHSLGDLTT